LSIDEAQLPAGDVIARVSLSTLNRKDDLGITSKGAVIPSFPMVPGIDLVGFVGESFKISGSTQPQPGV